MANFGGIILNQKISLLTGTAIVFILIAIISFFTLPSIVINQIHKRLVLREGSETYENWKQVPVPLYNRYYFFNIRNANEVERFGAKPELEEIGPFTYRVLLSKHNIVHNPSNGTVSYKERRTWIFIRNQSVSDESTMVSTLNTPLAMTLNWLQQASPAVRLVVGVALDTTSQGFFINRTVKQLLFEGYPDVLTTFGPLLRPELPSAYNGRFGFFYPKNNTDDGVYRVHTGEDNINLLNVMESHNGATSLKYYSTPECNSFAGTTKSEVRPPLTPQTRELRMFNAEICRVLRLVRSRRHLTTHGIEAERFVLDPSFYANSVDHPPNACFATKRATRPQSLLSIRSVSFLRQDPLPSGILDLGPCKYGAPIYLSNPHFLDADPIYGHSVTGLKPNRSRHSFWIDVEPTTGSTIGVAARVQLNVAISTGQASIRFRNVPEIAFPILWSEYTSSLTPRLIDKLLIVQWIPEASARIASFLFSTLAFILFTIALGIHTIRVLKDNKDHKAIDAFKVLKSLVQGKKGSNGNVDSSRDNRNGNNARGEITRGHESRVGGGEGTRINNGVDNLAFNEISPKLGLQKSDDIANYKRSLQQQSMETSKLSLPSAPYDTFTVANEETVPNTPPRRLYKKSNKLSTPSAPSAPPSSPIKTTMTTKFSTGSPISVSN
ncbi:platelet glycoprotein 4-like [Panonychus citri]|uniref:platelet glycoprotein 4-like n=1 Tax=Panonychus citri TaxID=50023 RepID=UPI002307BDA6|nr:platelet glycoprotein 4-like [Panonychus citri]XP_053200470.1 platelet glycoprotein 4-like [Panonychus citri]